MRDELREEFERMGIEIPPEPTPEERAEAEWGQELSELITKPIRTGQMLTEEEAERRRWLLTMLRKP